MIRITSGTAKNTILKTPDITDFRAVQDVAKQSIFATLEDRISEARCLDLYSGSGSLGIEALSRGADWCDFVDESRKARDIIIENIKKCRFEEHSEVFVHDVVKFVANTSDKYDIVFADPFYENTTHKFLVKNLEEVINKNGVVVFLHGENLKMEDLITDTKFKIETERKFGKSIFTILGLNK